MARDISVSIAVQGEREFNQALKNAQSAVKVLSSELKASEAAFDESADAQAFFANKTRNLNAQIEQQRLIYENLQKAVQDASNEFGAASAKTDKYRIELNKTEAAILKLEKTLRDTEKEAEEFGRDSSRIGRQITEGIGDGVEQATEDVERMVKEIREGLDDISGNVKLSVALDVGGSLLSGIDAAREKLTGFVEEAADFNRKWGALQTSTTLNGFDFGDISEQVQKAAALTGDLDNVVEGFRNLAATGFDLRELAESSELLSAAVIKFPSLDFASISEGILETIQIGEAAGAYRELLEKLGVSEERLNQLNTALKSTSNTEIRQQAVLGYLNEHGLEGYKDQFSANNDDMIAYYGAQTDYTIAQAELARELTPAATAAIEAATVMIEKATEATQAAKELWASYKEGEKQAEVRIEELSSEGSSYEDISAKITEKIQALQAAGQQLEAREMTAIQQQLDTVAAEFAFGGINREEFNAQLQALGEAAGISLTNGATSGLTESAAEAQETLNTVGSNMATEVGNGIVEGTPDAVSAASSLWNSINNILSREITIPSPKFAGDGGSNSGGSGSVRGTLSGGSNQTVVLNAVIEGRTVANAVADDVAANLGSQTDHYFRYG